MKKNWLERIRSIRTYVKIANAVVDAVVNTLDTDRNGRIDVLEGNREKSDVQRD